MREFTIIRVTMYSVKADFESEAIDKCINNKWDSESTKFIRMPDTEFK